MEAFRHMPPRRKYAAAMAQAEVLAFNGVMRKRLPPKCGVMSTAAGI